MIIPFGHSRLIGNRLAVDAGGRELYDLRDPLPRTQYADAQPIQLQQGDTLHQIAFEYYGDARLWWAIADYNGIFDVTTELAKGKMIVVPPVDAIESFVSRGE